jgi:site-specific recombinase XerD
VEAYLGEYRARGICEATVAHTDSRLRDWGSWLKSRRPRPVLDAIDPELHVRYLASRSAFRAKATVYGALSTMRCFGEYLVREGLWSTNPLRWMKGPKVTPYSRLPQRIDREHMEALWRAAAGMQGDYSRRLWITALGLLYGTGLRRGELERLEVRALLVSRRGEPLSAQAISNGIHALAQRAGVPLVSVHQFRHSCASDLLEAGVHLAEVQRILGHQGIATTVRYTHIADPARRAAMGLHPINAFLAQKPTAPEELAA